MRLWSCAGSSGLTCFPSREAEKGQFLALQELFNHDRLFHHTQQLPVEEASDGVGGFALGFADDHAFSSRQAVRFDDHGHVEQAQRFHRLVDRGAGSVSGSGDVVALHETLGEGFAGLEHRRGARRAEDGQAAPAKFIDQAKRKRQFRTDDGEVRLLFGDHPEQVIQVFEADRDAAGDGSDAAVAGSADNLAHPRGFADRPDQGVLPATGPKYQYFHQPVCSCLQQELLGRRLPHAAVEAKPRTRL